MLISNGDLGVCLLDVDKEWRLGCVLAGCGSAMETLVCVGWVLTSNADMGLCWDKNQNGDMSV